MVLSVTAKVEQLDALRSTGKSLEGQFESREASELDLQAKPTISTGLALKVNGLGHLRVNGSQLAKQGRTVCVSVLTREVWVSACGCCGTESFWLSRSLEMKVWSLSCLGFRHLEALLP
ncbi:protein of unknown function [Pseudomonas mediterranea]|jgi:hypothetical protein